MGSGGMGLLCPMLCCASAAAAEMETVSVPWDWAGLAEAAWVAPLLTAATGCPAPAGQIWQLPAEVLTQLIFGLNSLIGASRLVLHHDFRIKKY